MTTIDNKRYAVFAYDENNAEGGFHDLLGFFDEIPESFNTDKEIIEVYDLIKREYV